MHTPQPPAAPAPRPDPPSNYWATVPATSTLRAGGLTGNQLPLWRVEHAPPPASRAVPPRPLPSNQRRGFPSAQRACPGLSPAPQRRAAFRGPPGPPRSPTPRTRTSPARRTAALRMLGAAGGGARGPGWAVPAVVSPAVQGACGGPGGSFLGLVLGVDQLLGWRCTDVQPYLLKSLLLSAPQASPPLLCTPVTCISGCFLCMSTCRCSSHAF